MDKVFDVAVVGSGPAGLTAAIYTTRGSASTLILAGNVWGGQLMLTTTVENFPGFPDGVMGPDIMANMRKQAQNLGSKIVDENVSEVDFSVDPFVLKSAGESYQAKTVIIATGAETLWLNVKGEKELIGRGVSSCAPCDAPFFKGKNVAVVGGGDAAMEEALVLAKFANLVTVIHRRDSFKASAVMQEKVLKNEKIKVLWNTEVQEVVGSDKLEKLILKNNKDNNVFDFALDGVFVAIGHSPSSQIFQGKIDLDEKGFVKRFDDEKYRTKTSREGVFVAGDVHDHHYKQAITAAGFGCMAGLDTLKYLEENDHYGES